MLRPALVALIAAVGMTALASNANADHRWRRHHTFYPLIDVFPFNRDEYDNDNDAADSYDDEHILTDEEYRRILKRRAKIRAKLAAQQQILEDDDFGDLEPVYVKPVKKPQKNSARAKKKSVAKSAVTTPKKPVAKPVAKPALKVASASAGDPVAVSTTAQAKTATATSAPKKSIGCTAGAAVVTGYGFADVKPKSCTGATYAYNAIRGGKSYLIELAAASGEVLDVKKIQ